MRCDRRKPVWLGQHLDAARKVGFNPSSLDNKKGGRFFCPLFTFQSVVLILDQQHLRAVFGHAKQLGDLFIVQTNTAI
jgi:hypothetical protein